MLGWFLVALSLWGCGEQHGRVLDPGRLQERERALGMFLWQPPPPPPEPVSERWGKPKMVTEEQALAAAAPTQKPAETPVSPAPPAAPVYAVEDIERRATVAADWSAHAGPGITSVEVFGPGSRGIVIYGPRCSDAWVEENVAPIWPALRQHGFIGVHCQGAVTRFSWPRSH
jgi:hypothetical protein